MPLERLLVVLPSWVGDAVMATPALRALRRHRPGARITYLLRSGLQDLLAGCPWFDDALAWPTSRTAWEYAALIRRLRSVRPDAVVLFPNSFRSALFARLSGAPRRVGYAREGRGWLLTDRLAPLRDGRRFRPEPMVVYYRRLAEALECPVDDDRLELHTCAADHARLCERLGDVDSRPIAVLNPGASYGPAKCWPAERYAELADRLSTRGLRVVASLGPGESEIAARLARAARSRLTILADPPLGLGPLKALIAGAQVLVTNDTGPRHFAAAFDVPVVTLYGSSDPAWTATGHRLERSLMLSLDCQPCMKRVCPLGHHNCMQLLTVDAVAAAVDRLLESRRREASPAGSVMAGEWRG